MSLLETRRLVLEKTGSDIQLSTELSSAESLLATTDIDLLILCHSLTRKEALDALDGNGNPATRLEADLLTVDDDKYPQGAQLEVLSAFTGPRELIAAVEHVLAQGK